MGNVEQDTAAEPSDVAPPGPERAALQPPSFDLDAEEAVEP